MIEDKDHNDGETLAQTQCAPQLSAIELRVLGALMEKQLTTPDAYPLTVNSIQNACNQKSSRDPVSHYEPGELKRALQMLEDKKFVHREYGSRAEKYDQRFIKHLELGKKQQALLCVMMLRGPQTLSELHTRTQRMCEFTDRGDVEHSVDRLCSREVPYAIRLGQQPGHREERICHLFSGTPATFARHESTSSTAHSSSTQYRSQQSQAAETEAASDKNETIELLTMEIAELRTKVTTLDAETRELKNQLAQLYVLTGNESCIATGSSG